MWWTPDQQLPMRPSDGRIWHSKNLRCDRCSSDCCVCRAPCCKWKEAGNVLADDSSKESDKEVAGRLLQLLQEVMPRGVDPTTHVQCSTPGGCGLFACPDCAGRCPTALCQDIQCKVRSVFFLSTQHPVLFLTSPRTASRIRGANATGTKWAGEG